MTPTLRPRLETLTADEPERIVEDALLVLASVGVRVDHEAGRQLLLAAGGEERGDRLLLPESMVRAALASCPPRVPLYDREGKLAADLGGDRVHFDPGSAAIHLLDSDTGERRPAATSDVVGLVRLVDALSHYAVQSTALTPSDVPPEIADRYRLFLALRHGRKPVVTGTFTVDGFAPMREMLVAARGGEAELAAKPLAIFDCCPSPPLHWSALTCGALLDCARHRIPAALVSMPLTGATSPVTLREAVVQHCAENLSGICLHQLAGPGAPLVYGGAPSAFDMRRGTTPMGAIETMLIDCLYTRVGKHLGLPTHAYLALSDAKTPDYQAGLETGLGAILGALAGVNLISGPGILDYILTQSLEKLVLDHEACGLALRFVRGIGDRAEAIPELFADLVRTGELLSHPHTRRHWREELTVPSAVIDRQTWSDWDSAGRRTAVERAREEVRRILAESGDASADAGTARALEAIMRREGERCGLRALPSPRGEPGSPPHGASGSLVGS